MMMQADLGFYASIFNASSFFSQCCIYCMFLDSNIDRGICSDREMLTLVLLNVDLSLFENTVDPDQLASDEAS